MNRGHNEKISVATWTFIHVEKTERKIELSTEKATIKSRRGISVNFGPVRDFACHGVNVKKSGVNNNKIKLRLFHVF